MEKSSGTMSVNNGYLTFFPQFCKEHVNDKAWYSGFTDWDLIKELPTKMRRRFTPALGFYDLSVPQVISRQFDAIGQSPWPGMALYHYFFDGQFVLESVERHILEAGSRGPSFFILWANETWTKRWIGKPTGIIKKKRHSSDPAIVRAHVDRLSRLMKH